MRWYNALTMCGLDDAELREIIAIARETGCVKVRLKLGDEKFRAVLTQNGATTKCQKPSTEESLALEDLPARVPIGAPGVGYFRPAKEPLAVGDKVDVGDVVGMITALGLAHEVTCPVAGLVTEVTARDGEPMQFGQPIFWVEVAS